jgi:hypothetical protein
VTSDIADGQTVAPGIDGCLGALALGDSDSANNR